MVISSSSCRIQGPEAELKELIKVHLRRAQTSITITLFRSEMNETLRSPLVPPGNDVSDEAAEKMPPDTSRLTLCRLPMLNDPVRNTCPGSCRAKGVESTLWKALPACSGSLRTGRSRLLRPPPASLRWLRGHLQPESGFKTIPKPFKSNGN